ncbi:MAG: ribosome-associated translation inhibitor RaiA [Pirellulaceae bacterium]
MQVSVSARHGNLNAGDQSLIEDKVGKLRRLYDRVNAIEVIVDLEKLDSPMLEVKVSVEHEDDFVASATATTVIGALDVVIPKLEKQLRRAKEKRTEHRATGIKHMEPTDVTDVPDEV